MNSSGISRRIDELGRIVIPVEIRRALNIKEGENLEFNINSNGILLTKKSYIENEMDFLKHISKVLIEIIVGDFFITDREKIILSSNAEIINNNINTELINLLNVHNESVINNSEIVNSTLYVYPYYFEDNISGFICLYNIDNIEKYKKLIKFVSSYIHNRLSLSWN